MRKSFFITPIIIFTFFFTGCEEVVDIDLEETTPRVVIEASIIQPASGVIVPQIIKLSTTAPFFNDEIPPLSGAEVSISDEEGNIFEFQEMEDGFYRNDGFSPIENNQYELEIITENGEIYKATERFITVPTLEYITQENNGGFNGENIELKAFFTDPANETNFYLFRILHEDLTLQISNDEFVNGNLTFAYYSKEDLKAGDNVTFEIQGISRRFYEYMFILRSQAGSGGGPFQTQPTTVRGNVINTTNPDNFPFGFFRLSQSNNLRYTVQ